MSHDKYYLKKQAVQFIKTKLADERISDNNRETWRLVLDRILIANPVNGQMTPFLLEMLPMYAWDR